MSWPVSSRQAVAERSSALPMRPSGGRATWPGADLRDLHLGPHSFHWSPTKRTGCGVGQSSDIALAHSQ